MKQIFWNDGSCRRMLTALAGLVLTSLAACSGSYRQSLDLDPHEPLRVAVLPFAVVDKQGNVADLKSELLIDNVALVSSKLEEAPPNFLRNLVIRGLERTDLDLIPQKVVDNAFHHRAFSEKGVLDLKRIYGLSPQELGDLLDCDAVLFGRVTEWSRNYYAVQTVATISFDLKLVSAKSGKVLFSSAAEDSESRGLTKGPTGWTSLVLEPVKGLDNEIVSELARRMVDKSIAPLLVDKRPEVLQSIPPSIFASSHDARNGAIPHGSRLVVLALGTSKQTATFSIGNVVVNVPMVEQDEGHYLGEYYPLPTDRFQDEVVSVTLTDSFGRMTSQKIGYGKVSLGGS